MLRHRTLLAALGLALGCSGPTDPSRDADTGVLGPRPLAPEPIPRSAAIVPGEYVQEAIDAAISGATVRLPPGTYIVTQEIVIRGPVHVIGSSETVLELAPNAGTSVVGVYGRPDSPVEGVCLENLRIVGSGHDSFAGAGVTFINAASCTLRSVTVSDCYEDGVYASGLTGSLFENLRLSRNGRHGLAFGEASDRPSTGNAIVSCVADGNVLHGFDGEPVDNSLFLDCEASDNFGDGFNLGAEARSRLNRLVRCRALHNGRSGITLWAPEHRLEECLTGWNVGAGIAVIGPRAEDNAVVGCTSAFNGWHGISLDRTERARVEGNFVLENALGGQGDGIAAVSSIIVSGNRFVGNVSSGCAQRYALVVGSGLRDTVVKENRWGGKVHIAPGTLAL